MCSFSRITKHRQGIQKGNESRRRVERSKSSTKSRWRRWRTQSGRSTDRQKRNETREDEKPEGGGDTTMRMRRFAVATKDFTSPRLLFSRRVSRVRDGRFGRDRGIVHPRSSSIVKLEGVPYAFQTARKHRPFLVSFCTINGTRRDCWQPLIYIFPRTVHCWTIYERACCLYGDDSFKWKG